MNKYVSKSTSLIVCNLSSVRLRTSFAISIYISVIQINGWFSNLLMCIYEINIKNSSQFFTKKENYKCY